VHPYIYVSTVVRGAEDRGMTGFFYKVDWRERKIIAQTPVPPTYGPVIGSRGGSRGGRGLAFCEQRLYAATFDKILVYDAEFQLQKSVLNPLALGHHEIQVDRDGIWCCSTLIDAILRLDQNGRYVDGIFLGEERALMDAGGRYVPRDRNRNYLAEAESDSDSAVFEEQFHLNTVTLQPGGALHAFACATGHLVQIRPEVRVLATLPQLVAAHNVQFVGDRLFANNTRARCFEIYERDDLSNPSRRLRLDDGTGPSNQFATSGWIRGMCWVNANLLVVGSSPAQLIAIDLHSGRVVDRLVLVDDVSHAVHGLCSAPA
jgi:hypothetical protein